MCGTQAPIIIAIALGSAIHVANRVLEETLGMSGAAPANHSRAVPPAIARPQPIASADRSQLGGGLFSLQSSQQNAIAAHKIPLSIAIRASSTVNRISPPIRNSMPTPAATAPARIPFNR